MSDTLCTRLLPVVLLFLAAAGAAGQQEKTIILEHADSLVGRIVDGEEARELVGNVRISQETVRITCDRALQLIARGAVILTGNVIVRDESVTMSAPRAIYHRDERRAEAFEHVVLDDGLVHLTAGEGVYLVDSQKASFRTDVVFRDSSTRVDADSVVYHKAERRSVAVGHVLVRSTTDNVAITGGRLDHDPAGKRSRMSDQPVFMQVDTSSGQPETLLVKSAVMESIRDSLPQLVATDSVRILRRDLAATAALAHFFTSGDSILLRGAPVIWYGNTQVTGDSVNVYLRDRKLHRLQVLGAALAISRPDSPYTERFDQLAGDTLTMVFGDSGVESIRADARSMSIYYVYEDSVANGLNRASGDRIVLRFAQGKVHEISIAGGVEGQYMPEPVVRLRESEFRLAGFDWKPGRPSIPLDEQAWRGRSNNNN